MLHVTCYIYIYIYVITIITIITINNIVIAIRVRSARDPRPGRICHVVVVVHVEEVLLGSTFLF